MSTIGNERAQKALAEKTRTAFNEVAQGKGHSEGEEKGRPDKATHDHNIEPSIAEKKQRAVLDRAAAQRMFEKHKAKQQSLERKGPELGL